MKMKSWTITEVGEEEDGDYKLSINIQEVESADQAKKLIRKLKPLIAELNGQETLRE